MLVATGRRSARCSNHRSSSSSGMAAGADDARWGASSCRRLRVAGLGGNGAVLMRRAASRCSALKPQISASMA
jgi:hypothetical protein